MDRRTPGRFGFFFSQDLLFPCAFYRVSGLFVMDRKTREITVLSFADTHA
ncbi:hypothetical protein [Deinococcus roseus]|nr:hypothetical protein [Deinococcus roseus]